MSLPTIQIRPFPEVGTTKAHVPLRIWAQLGVDEKRDIYMRLLSGAMQGVFADHPDCFYQFHFAEEHPDVKETLDATKDPEILCTCHVSIYERL